MYSADQPGERRVMMSQMHPRAAKGQGDARHVLIGSVRMEHDGNRTCTRIAAHHWFSKL